MKIYNYFNNMARENISHVFRLKKVDKTRNDFLEEINQNESISKKHQKVCTILNNTEDFLI